MLQLQLEIPVISGFPRKSTWWPPGGKEMALLSKDVGVYAVSVLLLSMGAVSRGTNDHPFASTRQDHFRLWSNFDHWPRWNSGNDFDLFSPARRRRKAKKEDRENDRDPRPRGRNDAAISPSRLSCSFPADIKDRSAWYVGLFSGSHNFHVFTSTTDRTLRLFAW